MSRQFWMLFLMRVVFNFMGSRTTWSMFRDQVEKWPEWGQIYTHALDCVVAGNQKIYFYSNFAKVKAIKLLREVCRKLDPIAGIKDFGSPNMHSALKFAYREWYGPAEEISLLDCKRIVDTMVEQMKKDNKKEDDSFPERPQDDGPPTLGSMLRDAFNKRQLREEGWIEWKGVGKPPLPDEAQVEVLVRGSEVGMVMPLWAACWPHKGIPGDILWYRVVKN